MINFIIGVGGSGKSTYIYKNAKEGDIIIDWDDIKETLNDVNALIVNDVIQTVLSKYKLYKSISGSYCMDIWISSITPSKKVMDSIKGQEVKWTLLNTSLDKVVSNKRKRDRFGTEATESTESIEKRFNYETKAIDKFLNNNHIDINVIENK